MSGFTKFHTSMLQSSVWYLPKDAKILWVAMLLAKDRRQIVEAGIPGLAGLAVLTIDETAAALALLTAPDPHSKNQEQGGRRVIKVEGGYKIVNGEFYRDEICADDRREYQRNWKRGRKKPKKPGGGSATERETLKLIDEGKVCAECHLPFVKWVEVGERACLCPPKK